MVPSAECYSGSEIRALFALLCAVLACLAVSAPRAVNADPARRVYVGVYLRDVTHFDQRNGTYDVDMETWVKWRGEFDHTTVRVANESSLEKDDLGSEDDGDWHVRRSRMRGTLRGEFPLHRFPFDDQTLGVEFELPDRDAVLEPDLTGSGMQSHFSVTGWLYEPHFRPVITQTNYPSDLGSLAHEGQHTDVHRVRFEVSVHRPAITAALKLFLPLVLILLVALVALFMPPEFVDARTGIGVTALLACFAFQFTVAGTIPDVAYLTLADSLFLVAYGVTVLALLSSVAVFWLHRHENARSARRLDLGLRFGLPGLGAAVAIGLLIPPHPARPRPAVSPPHVARTPSARPLLRLGVSQLPSLMNSAITGASRRSLVRNNPDGTLSPELAEEVPSVANDALQLRADGRLVVRWRLRENLRWSDGHPLTSDDVRFAYEVSPDPRVVEVHTPSARVVNITYSGVTGASLTGVLPLPRHALGDAMRRGGYDAVMEARRTRPMPGAGPYRVRSFTAEREATLEANPNFYGLPPAIERIEIRCIADQTALTQAFERGELDMIAPSALSLDVAEALAARIPRSVLMRPANQLYALQPDPAVPMLDRLPVRVALLRAIDRTALTHALFNNEGRVASVPMPGVNADPDEEVRFDLAAAREALVHEGVAGQTVKLTYANVSPDREAATRVAEAWRAAGMIVETVAVPSVAAMARSRTHGGLLLMSMMAEPDTEVRRFWNLPRDDGRVVLTARTTAFDNTVADLTEREERSLFPERRQQIRDRLLGLFAARLPLIPLVFGSERYVVSPSLRGWDRGPGVRFGDGIDQWYFSP